MNIKIHLGSTPNSLNSGKIQTVGACLKKKKSFCTLFQSNPGS